MAKYILTALDMIDKNTNRERFFLSYEILRQYSYF